MDVLVTQSGVRLCVCAFQTEGKRRRVTQAGGQAGRRRRRRTRRAKSYVTEINGVNEQPVDQQQTPDTEKTVPTSLGKWLVAEKNGHVDKETVELCWLGCLLISGLCVCCNSRTTLLYMCSQRDSLLMKITSLPVKHWVLTIVAVLDLNWPHRFLKSTLYN